MSDIDQWDPVDANNNDPPPDGAPEGGGLMKISDTNDNLRAIQGAVRRWYDTTEARLQQLETNTIVLPVGMISGLRINRTNIQELTIDAGKTVAHDGSEIIELTSSIKKVIFQNWTEGDNGGGLDTGSVAADEVYGIWVIKNPTSGVVDVLFSLQQFSVSGLALPAGYTKAQLIGAWTTNATFDFHFIAQRDNFFQYTQQITPIILNTADPSTVLAPLNVLAPVESLAMLTVATIVSGVTSFEKFGFFDTSATRDGGFNEDSLFTLGEDSDGRVGVTAITVMAPVDGNNQVNYYAFRDGAQSYTDFRVRTQGYLMQRRGRVAG